MKYRIRLMFEWGGGTIWSGNDIARIEFGVGPIEDLLPISDVCRGELKKLSEWHDTALNWNDPAAQSPWPDSEFKKFKNKSKEILKKLQDELGKEFEIVNEEDFNT